MMMQHNWWTRLVQGYLATIVSLQSNRPEHLNGDVCLASKIVESLYKSV